LRAVFLLFATLCVLPALTAEPLWAAPALEDRNGPGAGRAMTADDLASWVLEANPGLAAIAAAAEAAAYRIEPAGSLDDPTLSYAVAPLTANADRSLNQKIDFSQKIPWPGTLAARESAARFEAVAAERDAESLRLRVIAQAKSAHAEWWFVEAALDIHHATLALLDELIATAQTRYASGRAQKQDVLQAEVERSELDRHLLSLLRQRATVRARINALLDRVPDAPLPAAAPIPRQSTPPALEDLQTLALARHPELSRLNAAIAASESRITLAEKAFYPDFQIGVGYDGLWDPTDKRPVFGVSINVPLNRSKRRSELDRAHAETRRTRFSLAERRAGLLAELASAHAELVEAQSSVALYQNELVPLTAEYLEATIADYQSGAGPFLNVITAEQRKLDTDLELARVLSDYARRRAELELWAGGSLNPSLSTRAGANQ
jgi:outer membrane protein TolC